MVSDDEGKMLDEESTPTPQGSVLARVSEPSRGIEEGEEEDVRHDTQPISLCTSAASDVEGDDVPTMRPAAVTGEMMPVHNQDDVILHALHDMGTARILVFWHIFKFIVNISL